ncbi:MAG: hypothetical protein PHI98_08265 [Eubacteriales bacterium]|nr:hypothetical protein [Eubacteriales bacterium]
MLMEQTHEKYNISMIDEVLHEKSIFYKEQWLEIGGVMQRLAVTYSVAYRNYLASIRERQLIRLAQTIENNPGNLSRKVPNNNKRFLTTTHCTKDGEVAKSKSYSINQEAIAKEAIRGLKKMKMFLSVTFIVYLGLAKAKIARGEREHLCRMYA